MDSEAVAKILGVCGPLLAAVGAALLTYDALRGPVRFYQQVYFPRRRFESQERVHESNLKSLSLLPVPPYTQEEKERLISEQINKHREIMKKEMDSVENIDLEERFMNQRLAFWGFPLIAVGSLMQVFAAILS